jgi:CRISPR-associated protein Cmr6
MTNPNIAWLFYKDYYKSIEYIFKDDTEKDNKNKRNRSKMLVKNEQLLKMSVNKALLEDLITPNSNSIFSLSTTYPGLLIGSGYNHAVGAEGEFKIGFFFDHVTGLPIIPGSSVKGLLRSAFPQRNITGKKAKHQDAKVKFIRKLLSEINPSHVNIDIDKLEQIIFDGIDISKPDSFLPTSKRVIFHDAILDKNTREIFEQDFITPHKNKLKEPVPIMFLKIKPNISFMFQFKIEDIMFNGLTISKNEIKSLFEKIIKCLGIGAKTNVGYGAMK